MTKVVIVVPSGRGEVKAGFAFDYARLVEHTCRKLPHVKLGFVNGGGSLLHDLRNHLASEALKTGGDWVLWLDDDMRFPPDALDRLLTHRRDIVGCNYVTRTIPPRPTAKRLLPGGQKALDVPTLPNSTGLEEVDGCGFGCMLTHTRVFQKLSKPWFSMPWAPDSEKHVGEDIYFCVAAGAAGHPTFIVHDLSKEIKHVGQFEFTWDHYEAVRDLDKPAQ